jgi:putative ABC transport system permease protein
MSWLRSRQILQLALRNFRRSRLQVTLAVVAAMGGTGGIIVCTGYVAAGRAKVFEQFRHMGTNIIIVTPRQSRAVGGRARTGTIVTTLRDPDVKAIIRSVPEIALSSPTVSTSLRIRAGDLTKSTTIVGCLPEFFAMRSWVVKQGASFNAADVRSERRVALLGATVARDLFGAQDPTGQRIIIGRVPFTVSGVLQERGQGVDAANEDAQVYIPLTTAMRRLLNQEYYASILFEINSWQNMDAAAVEIKNVLESRHKFWSTGGDTDFDVANQKSLVDTQLAAFARLTFFVRLIAGSMLGLASLGIFGVAWIAVGQRRREIGTCRAIGATGRDVLTQYLAEGLAGPLMGCTVGIALSWPALRAIDARVGQPFLFSVPLAVESALASAVLYAAATLISSRRAVTIEPSVALRSE